MKTHLKTYATLGPACCQPELLQAMLNEGLTGFRLNLSHGSLAEQRSRTEAVQAAARAAGREAELIIDLRGPELRCGALPQPLRLRKGETVLLGRDIPMDADILAAIRPGQRVLLDDDGPSLTAESLCPEGVLCRIERGGIVSRYKSVTLPGVALHRPVLCEQDREDLRHAAEQGVTAVMQPFVRSRQDLTELRESLNDMGLGHLKLFAKVEEQRGWRSLEEWMDLCDVVTIARGDLGSSLGLLRLPGAQKDIAARCRAAGKPFLVVTQLLDSMTHRPLPSRAEVLDVYNALLDGASALMLTGETAGGDFPLEAVQWLLRIIHQAEREQMTVSQC